jgi:hypothetical protein
MISDTLSDAVADIDRYLADPAFDHVTKERFAMRFCSSPGK